MRIKVITLAALFFTVLSSSGCGGGSGGAAPESTPATQQVFNQGQVMPAGFQVIGSAGNVQIDGNNINLGLIAKGTVTIPAAGSITSANVSAIQMAPQIVVTGSTPILCIAPKIVSATIARVQQNGTTFSYTIAGSASANGETFNWYLFDKMSLTSQGNSGLQVFNGSGQIVFNSNSSPMRIAGIGQIPGGTIAASPANVQGSGSGVYAACISQGRIDGAWDSFYTHVMLEGVTVNGGGASTSQVLGALIPAQISSTSSPGGQILLVDVSGL